MCESVIVDRICTSSRSLHKNNCHFSSSAVDQCPPVRSLTQIVQRPTSNHWTATLIRFRGNNLTSGYMLSARLRYFEPRIMFPQPWKAACWEHGRCERGENEGRQAGWGVEEDIKRTATGDLSSASNRKHHSWRLGASVEAIIKSDIKHYR